MHPSQREKLHMDDWFMSIYTCIVVISNILLLFLAYNTPAAVRWGNVKDLDIKKGPRGSPATHLNASYCKWHGLRRRYQTMGNLEKLHFREVTHSFEHGEKFTCKKCLFDAMTSSHTAKFTAVPTPHQTEKRTRVLML